mgnify:CR=1 FL=1|tara:strand:- start:78 stop:230 length:153 start_codon:yes stop_codon:yes gene_type:complete
MTTQETKVKGVQRLNNSINGNPKYRFHTDNFGEIEDMQCAFTNSKGEKYK